GTRKEPGHVGIYVDDGYIIDAPHTGTVVRLDSLSDPKLANEYVGAKRITGRLHEVRELFHATGPEGSNTGLFPYPAADGVEPLSESVGLAVATAAIGTSSAAHWMWAGLVVGGMFAWLLAGALFVRRHRATPLLRP